MLDADGFPLLGQSVDLMLDEDGLESMLSLMHSIPMVEKL